jgi:hypothetical protein
VTGWPIRAIEVSNPEAHGRDEVPTFVGTVADALLTPGSLRMSRPQMIRSIVLIAAAILSTQCKLAGRTDGAASGEVPGSVRLALTTPGGLTFTSVSYELLESSGTVEKSGQIDVSQSNVAATVIGGVRPERGLTVELDAASTDGATKCTGTSAPFDVTANHTTSVTVTLRCPAKPTGAVAVNASVNECPSINSGGANPSEANVGAAIALIASATDPDNGPSPLSYSWSATGSAGALSDPSLAMTSFVCSTSGSATITVVVSDGDPACDATMSFDVVCDAAGVTLFPNVHVADQSTNAALTSYDSVSGQLVYSVATPAVAKLQPGDVLVSGAAVGTVAPHGYMRKVVSVQMTGGGALVSTTPAALKDVVSSAKIDATQAYTTGGVTRFTPTVTGVTLGDGTGGPGPDAGFNGGPGGPGPDAGAKASSALALSATPGPMPPLPGFPAPTPVATAPSNGININLNNVSIQFPPGGGSVGTDTISGQLQATLNGWINVNATPFVHIDLDGCGFACQYLRHFDVGINLDQRADVQADVEASVMIQPFSQKLADIDLGVFCTYVLCWFPTFEVDAEIGISGQISISLHATDDVSVSLGAQFNDDNRGHSGWQPLANPTVKGSFDVPSVNLSVTASAGVKGEFSLLLYDVVGSTASTEAALVFDIATPHRPFVDFKLELTQSVGIEATVFGIVGVNPELPIATLDFPLGQSPNIPPIIVSTSPPSGSASPREQLSLQVQAYDLQDGTSLTYAWTDEAGLFLGNQATVNAPSVPAGVHDFTVAVTDAVGATTRATIHGVTVSALTPPPTIAISAPTNNAAEFSGLPFALAATVQDDHGVSLCGNPSWAFKWMDETTGTPLALGCTGSATLSTAGAHVLSLTATGPSGAPTIAKVVVTVSAPQALQASIVSGLVPNKTSGTVNYLMSTESTCLPAPVQQLVGQAIGGSPPYTYRWIVQPLPKSGTTPPPVTIATTASTSTAAFPSSWFSLLSPEAQTNAGELVTLTFQATDSTGATATAETPPQGLQWVCVSG